MKAIYTPAPPEGVYTVLPLSVLPSVQDIFRRIFISSYWLQKSYIWLQASYRYAILWEAFLDPSDSYFLFANLVGFYAHWTYMRGYYKWALAHSSSCLFCFRLDIKNADDQLKDVFIVDGETLKIGTATEHLNYEETKVFTILVNSVDSGIPQMDVNDTINIVIQDVNDPPSDIIFSKYTVSTSHNS